MHVFVYKNRDLQLQAIIVDTDDVSDLTMLEQMLYENLCVVTAVAQVCPKEILSVPDAISILE